LVDPATRQQNGTERLMVNTEENKEDKNLRKP
jgi:hypothetical protein